MPSMELLDDSRARNLTLAAIGAVNRRDLPWASGVVRTLASDDQATMVAIDACAAILLRGIPCGSLDPAARIAVTVPGAPPEESAVDAASALLSGLACADNGRVVSVLMALAQGQAYAVLDVLVRAAAGWVDAYVGIDGDTVDSYYAISKAT
ncbi:hypothetical protein SAMN05216553_10334 [Lentzea fradiae]|uniref:Uncharacterized protein n=1 Tax=Lentzea fradiae TaxID=200378 RepID=A0A1G7NIF6_9PSEU|nr:hypothetical protein [Lentzea fradiae]SDF73746.1 hypothetical protein SAMN05216553_10334 [Lentzea fradiae]